MHNKRAIEKHYFSVHFIHKERRKQRENLWTKKLKKLATIWLKCRIQLNPQCAVYRTA